MIKRIRDYAIMLGITLVLFGVLEGVLRLIYSERLERDRTENIEKPAYEFDSETLVRLIPNVEKVYVNTMENGSEMVQWTTNSDGFRGNELEKNPDYRILLYGDSNIQARFSETEDTYAYQIQTHLRQFSQKNIEVINAGIVGAGPDQYLLNFQRHFEKYQPNLVLFHITCHNDFGDLLRNRLFDLDTEGKLTLTTHKRQIDKALEEKETPKKAWKSYINSLLTVKAGIKIRDVLFPMSPQDHIDFSLTNTEIEYQNYLEKSEKAFGHFDDYAEVGMSCFPNSEPSKLKKKIMNEVLKEAQFFAGEKQIPFYISIQPCIVDITTNVDLTYKNLGKFEEFKQTNVSDIVEEICVNNQIHHTNLYDVFIENDPNSLYFLVNNAHWNNKGQALAAEVVSKALWTRFIKEKLH